jgi:hypothetical protein
MLHRGLELVPTHAAAIVKDGEERLGPWAELNVDLRAARRDAVIQDIRDRRLE